MTKATPTSETNETELSFGTKALRRDGAQKNGHQEAGGFRLMLRVCDATKRQMLQRGRIVQEFC